MQRKRWYGRDTELQVRMAFTLLMLTVLYLVFAFILFKVTGLGLLIFVIPIGGLFLQYYFSDKIVLATAGARVIEPAQAPELYGTVQRIAQTADLPMPRVAIVDTPMPNAFATGRSPKHAVVAVTTGLLNQLSQPELEAVLAHEMTHIRNRDMTVMAMAGSFAAVASWITQWGLWFGIGSSDDDDNNNGSAFFIILIASVVVALLSHLLLLALSRYREYAADRGSAILTGQPENLQSALLRISGNMQKIPDRDLRAAQGLSAFYIAAPSKDTLFELMMDHPPIEKRIARLQAFERQMVAR